jgi:hypothetical protein
MSTLPLPFSGSFNHAEYNHGFDSGRDKHGQLKCRIFLNTRHTRTYHVEYQLLGSCAKAIYETLDHRTSPFIFAFF